MGQTDKQMTGQVLYNAGGRIFARSLLLIYRRRTYLLICQIASSTSKCKQTLCVNEKRKFYLCNIGCWQYYV